MSEYIPLEIQEEILKRLPVKPLIQFRSVSKPWKGLIDSPDFIVLYGVRRPQPDRFILRFKVRVYSHYHGEDRYITLVDNDDSFVQQEFIPKVPDLFEKLQPHLKFIVGSSHGLLCFKVHPFKGRGMVVLWNPSIRKSIGIQVPDIYDSNNKILYSNNVFGFGVSPTTLDPTILKIERILYKRIYDKREMIDMTGINDIPWKVGVFTLSTGAWSILSTNLPSESIRLTEDHQVVIDRFIYWVAFDKLGAKDGRSQSFYLIVSFDLTAKGFKEINLPRCLSNRSCRILGISKLRESLVVLAYHKEFEEDVLVYSLWMMKEEGFNRSFTKLYNINLLPDIMIDQLLGFRKTRDLIMVTQKQNAEVLIYDPNSEALDNLGIAGEVANSFFMFSDMETLLLLDQLDGFIYSI